MSDVIQSKASMSQVDTNKVVTTKDGQSKRMSLVESAVSVFAGYVLNVLIQFLVYPLFDIEIALEQAFIIALLITGIAFVKNYSVRRLFNLIHIRSSKQAVP